MGTAKKKLVLTSSVWADDGCELAEGADQVLTEERLEVFHFDRYQFAVRGKDICC